MTADGPPIALVKPRPTLLHPLVGVERAGPLASPYGAGAPGATMARRLHGFFGLGLGPALLPGMAAD
jgi:hypothetical protein